MRKIYIIESVKIQELPDVCGPIYHAKYFDENVLCCPPDKYTDLYPHAFVRKEKAEIIGITNGLQTIEACFIPGCEDAQPITLLINCISDQIQNQSGQITALQIAISNLKKTNAKIEGDLVVSLRKNDRLVDSIKSAKKSFWKRFKFLFCPKEFFN